jgi:polar amino acid transport system substrate-binding protein
MKKISGSIVLVGCLAFLAAGVLTNSASAQTRRQPGANSRPQAQPALPKPTLPSDDTLTMIRRKNRLDVGLSTFMPWAMHNKNGELIGFEVEVAKKLAQDLGVELQLHPVGFSNIIEDLRQNRFDIIVTGIYPTPQRALFVNFSEPYAESKIELVASRDKMRNKGDFKDYNDSDVTIGMVAGAIYSDYIRDNFPQAKMQTFEREDLMFQALADGKIEAAMASTPAPELAMKLHQGKIYRPLADPLAKLGESFAIRRGDTDFLNYLNTWIRYHNQTGWLQREHKKWFESDDWLNQL